LSSCSQSCGEGIANRTRSCSSPSCPGASTDTQICVGRNCPVDGFWASWTPWSSCSRSCGQGTITRTRSCSASKIVGKPCLGKSQESRVCKTKKCPAPFAWSTWGSWSSCTKSCGEGRSERQRSCTGGSGCSGDGIETRLCNSNSCPDEAKWSNWESWSSCTKSCGGGKSSRQRTCIGSVGCSGVMRAERLCNTNNCPAEVTWSNWGSWSSCTKSCGKGRSDRYRSCLGGSACTGDQSESKWCNTNTCPDVARATWSNWGPWSECTKTCGRGRSDRYRSCPTRSTCQGEGGEAKWCNTNTCPAT